jgi:hypothetical protein
MAKNDKKSGTELPKEKTEPAVIIQTPNIVGVYKPLPRVSVCKNC